MLIYGIDCCQSLKKYIKNTVNRTMGRFKYLMGIWTAIAVYSLFSLLYGPKGISAYSQLLSEREQQLANIGELGLINEELEKTKNNLLYDQDTILVHAREIGYGQEDERFIRIVGLGNIRNIPAVTGKVYVIKEPDFFNDINIKITALCAGLLIFAFMFMLELIETKVR